MDVTDLFKFQLQGVKWVVPNLLFVVNIKKFFFPFRAKKKLIKINIYQCSWRNKSER